MTASTHLKIYVTQIGLHETIVAVASQRAAIEALGIEANAFARGHAHDVRDREGAYAIALEQPGRVFARPAGSDKPFKPVRDAAHE